MPTCIKCKEDFPNRLLIKGKIRILNNRKYCLKCSPFGNHNTRQIHINTTTKKFCTGCKQTFPTSEFYKRRKDTDLSHYCKKCSTIQTRKRQRKIKEQSIAYKGGKCVKCGYDKCPAALQFHHLDPTKKEFTLSKCSLTSFEKVKSELDKCILLCSNCHAELHYKN